MSITCLVNYVKNTRNDFCITVVQDSRDMGESHVMGPTTWIPHRTYSMSLVSCTRVTVVQETFL
jgi:hypothetical protein